MGYPILSEESVVKVFPIKFLIYLNKEIKVCVLLQGYSLIGMREMWWESSDDWSAVVMDPGSLKGPGGEGEEQELPFLWEQQDCIGLWDGRWLRPAWVLWWWLSATGCMIRRKMRPSSDNSGKPHVHRPTSSWGILTSLISARRASQEGTWGAFWSSGWQLAI